MDKRIGTITILVSDRKRSAEINSLVSEFSDIILCRQGLPFHDRSIAVISLIVEGAPDHINALTGRLGRLSGVEAKSVLTKSVVPGPAMNE
ncbi:MAG: iron-only hydrogenase system regulator [Bacteroidales bacterium]|nr:iron-only hydrogenase system regulator [Bacteroidales bacterium]